jgi:hypothetical protein
MVNEINIRFFQKIMVNIIFYVLIFTLIFTRSFFGLKVFGFRLGELFVAFGLVLLIFFLFLNFINRNTFRAFHYKSFYLFFIVFGATFLLNKGSIFSTYTYKSSSFIWMIGYLFLGYYFFQSIEFKKIHIYLLSVTPYVIYLFNSGNYPNVIMKFFYMYSDKFQFTKGSDVLMAFVFCSFILKDKLTNEKYMLYLNITGGLLLPMFLTLSRASFFSGLLFLVISNFSLKKIIKKDIKKFIYLMLATILIFILSAIRVAALPELDNKTNPEPMNLVQESVNEIIVRKNTNKFFLGFYFCEGRLCSKDNTLDWRLDIWSDLVNDQIDKNKLVYGFGFNEIFEVMTDPTAPGRLGRDGLNENVHNHIFTIIGRMGLLGLVAYLFFQLRLISPLKNKIYIFLLPLFLVSAFDTTMESVQFPLLYYFLISRYYSNNSNL